MKKALDLGVGRVRTILNRAAKRRIIVVGDVMLDQFVWGQVHRISPEAPVPVVEFERESTMPGGAANVARNLTALGGQSEIGTWIGRDVAGKQLRTLLAEDRVNVDQLLAAPSRHTGVKTRIVAQQQQVVRLDRETKTPLTDTEQRRLMRWLQTDPGSIAAIAIGDYGKGMVTQGFLDALKAYAKAHGIWLSLDPKPIHRLDLTGLSLVTPNRKEAFELAGIDYEHHHHPPPKDTKLLEVADRLCEQLDCRALLLTLGEQGMLLCQPGEKPFHIPTIAREVFDVSGAGDTVIAAFTLAIAGGANPIEAAIISNHAGGVVVGKLGTATVSRDELLRSFQS